MESIITQQLQQHTNAAADTGSPEGPGDAPVFTVTKSQEMAEEFLKSLAALSETLPMPLEAEALVSSRNLPHINVNKGFLEATVAAVKDTPALQAATGMDVERAMETLQILDAWGPVLINVTAFTRRLRFALNSRKSPLGSKARTAYAVAQGLAKGNPHDPIAMHLQAMKSAARFNGGRRKEGKVQAG